MLPMIAVMFLSTAPMVPTEEEVLESTQNHFPVILQAIEGMQAAQGDVQARMGAFDAKVVSNNTSVPVGYYKRDYWDAQIEKSFGFAGSHVYAGYSYGFRGMFPPQYSTFSTNSGGTPRVGGSFSALRGFSIDARRAEIRKAELALNTSKLDIQRTRISVKRDARIAYWHWISTVRNVQIHQDLLDLAENRNRVLEQRARAGDISNVVVTENLQYIAHRRAELASAELGMRQSALDLSLFYRDQNGEPRLVGNVAPHDLDTRMQTRAQDVETNADHGLYPAFQGGSLLRRPDVLSLSNELAINQWDVKLAKNMFLPKLDLGIDYTKNIGNQDPSNAPHVLTIFINLEIPIEYNLLKGISKTAHARQRALTSQYNFLIQSIQVEIDKLRQAISFSRKRMNNAQQEMNYAKELVQAETYKFTQGGSNLFLVNIREAAYTQALQNTILSQLDLIRAQADYEASTTLAPKE